MRRSARGSSPQVRGRQFRDGFVLPAAGLIPAGAGQTAASPYLFGQVVGSSPQVRGRLRHEPYRAAASRLIPAGAGQTLAGAISGIGVTAHPRRCGADARTDLGRNCALGSSPQVRGRQGDELGHASAGGLIPAGAGQTDLVLGHGGFVGAHPRRCGADAMTSGSESM